MGISAAGVKPQLILYEGNTTSDGGAGKDTLIDSVLVGSNDFLSNTTIHIMSGDAIKETRRISSFASGTGTITVSTAFSAQIVSGISYTIIATIANAGGDATAANQLLILADTASLLVDTANLDATVSSRSTLTQANILSDTTPFAGADVPIIKADTQVIEDSTLKAAPTAGSLARFIASGGTALGTQLPDSKSLYDCLSGGVTAVNSVVGVRQVFEKSITANADAGATIVGTVATQSCVIESIIIYADTNGALPASTTAATTDGLAGVAGAVTFLDAGLALTANLDTAGDQVSWTAGGSGGAVRLAVGYQIITTLAGGGANPTDLTFVITYYSSAANGGTIS